MSCSLRGGILMQGYALFEMGRRRGKYNCDGGLVPVKYSTSAKRDRHFSITLILRSALLHASRRMKARLWPHGSRRAKSAPHHEGRRHLTTGNAAAAGSARGPRIFTSNSAVGQESAGRPYLTCIAFTAVRLCWPSTLSTLPTLNPARTRNCCSSLISLNGSCTTGADGGRMWGAPAMRVAR